MTLPGWVGFREPRGRLGGRYTKNVTICPTYACTTPSSSCAPTRSPNPNPHRRRGDITRDGARSEEAGVDRGVRTRAASTAVARAVSRACTERRAERQRRGGARAGCRVAARALVGAAQRRACWVPRSGARAGCRAAALGGGQATAGASTKVPCVFLRNWSLLRRKTNAQEGTGKLCHQHLAVRSTQEN